MDESVAARALAKALYRSGVVDGEQDFRESIVYLPSIDRRDWANFAEWFNKQDVATQNQVFFAVRQAVTAATRGIAVMFDGATGFEAVQGKTCEFIVSLRVFPDNQRTAPGDAEEIVPISPPERSDDIHDLVIALSEGEKL